ncbi:hypothetical protein ACFVU2_20450 [Leifsonia sp. NPDC058194]|uniref:hypothetical protein n=1 Tax=Leifsonia sp. NPDC058194 TaxID=3346374 RepID=UPI0036D8F9DA
MNAQCADGWLASSCCSSPGIALVIVPIAPVAVLGAVWCWGAGYGFGYPAHSGRRIPPDRCRVDGWMRRAVLLGVGALAVTVGALVVAHVVVFPAAAPLALIAGASAAASGFAARRGSPLIET